MQPFALHSNRREFLIGATALGAAAARGAEATVVVETRFGKVRGFDTGSVKIFKGIPYGETTSGRYRFMPPVDPQKWSRVRDALQYGPTAPQSDPIAAGEREDCLVLNIWTPVVGLVRRLPVMVWCHGGGFASGSGSSEGTDGSNLARRDVVVVSINHRLNALGFTFLGDLGGAEFASSGDVGMLDIVHALKWVRDNIAQFGGDPSTVTIFGQSGGGRKVGTLLAMPAAKGLFHRAVIQSGPTITLVEREQATRVASELLAKLALSKSKVRELQNIPIDRLMSAYHAVVRSMNVDQMTQGFSPTMEGKIIPQHPFHPGASAVSANVPLLAGCARTELTLGAQDALFSLSEEAMRGRIKDLLGDSAASVIDVYRKANPGASPSDLYFLIASDNRYGAPVMKIVERRAALGKAAVYQYYFRWETPVQGGRLKSPHTIDVPFVFDNVKISASLTGGGAEAMALADKVSDAWVTFARTGNPNSGNLPQWPAFEPTNRPTMVFNNQSKVEHDPIREQRIAMFSAMKLG